MTEKKWTPGPWKAMRNSAFWEINPVGDAGPFTIGDVCASAPGFPDGGLQEANARLIAAAPDLVDALEGLARVHRKTFGLDRAFDKEIMAAEAALAKAYGETG